MKICFKSILTAFVSILICNEMIAQKLSSHLWFSIPQQVQFNKIIPTKDGGFIVIGSYRFNNKKDSVENETSDAWVTKLDGNGNTLWQRNYGGSKNDEANAIKQTEDGGYILIGKTESSDSNITEIKSSSRVWLFKLNDTGKLEWQKTYSNGNENTGYDIVLANDGGYIFLSDAKKDNAHKKYPEYWGNPKNYWIVKTTVNGDIQWQRTSGSNKDDWPCKLVATANGSCIVGGTNFSDDDDVKKGFGETFVWLDKIDSNGNILWKNNYSGERFGYLEDFIINKSGEILLAGWSSISKKDNNSNENKDRTAAWIEKLDADGKEIWSKFYGNSNENMVSKMVELANGGYLVLGISRMFKDEKDDSYRRRNNNVWPYRIDEKGNLLWQKIFVGNPEEETPLYAFKKSDGSYCILGSSIQSCKPLDEDEWLPIITSLYKYTIDAEPIFKIKKR